MKKEKIECKYCGKEYTKSGIKNHEKFCKQNPNNLNVDKKEKDIEVIDDFKKEKDILIKFFEGKNDESITIRTDDAKILAPIFNKLIKPFKFNPLCGRDRKYLYLSLLSYTKQNLL